MEMTGSAYRNNKQRIIVAGVAATGLLVGFWGGSNFFPSTTVSLKKDDCNKQYSLLRSDIDCKTANDDYERVLNIQEILNTYINEQKSAGNVSRVSVFFRDLSSRRWAAVDKQAQYAPGSLLKIPLAIAYYKLSEIEPKILEEEYVYTPTTSSLNNVEYFKPKKELISGQTYSVEQLIEQMIVYSDNEATVLLNSSIDQVFLKKVLTDLGVHLPETGGGEVNFITTDGYSSILRSLYLSSYLSIDNAQKLLSLMAKTSFEEGIAYGVPDNITVAHKFGERRVVDSASQKSESSELHDCGIIYKKNHPYILCVMTEGKSYDKLTVVLSNVSKLVYNNSD